MDNITGAEKPLNETQDMVIVTRSASKRKHSDNVDDNENIKKQKVDPQNEQVKENIKVENLGKFLQPENDVSTKNTDENLEPTNSELNGSNIAHLKDDDAVSLDDKNEFNSNSTDTIDNDEEFNDNDNHRVSKIDESQHEQSDIPCTVCKPVSESDIISHNRDSRSTTGIENENNATSAVQDPEPIKRKEANKFRKLYRLLGDSENKDDGLTAKNPRSNTGVAEHVANGSNGGDSRYISTCSTLSAAQNLLRLKKRSRFRNGTHRIVEIDVNNLPLKVNIIDLTEENLRKDYAYGKEETIRNFHRYAESHGEVLLVGYIPAYCLQYV
ncbi:uncharacterized protein LOC134725419 [Mytilus trossulus]|uniref:uncharacterized protein LOC134725419 n=1 Tax=Mytilus trossulus TaxID=6551 RepID=UPI003004FDD0